jgi:hypothetical protein
MKVRTLFLLIVVVAIGVFATLNWNVIVMPTTLSLGVTVVEAPLGLVMLGILVFLTASFLVFVVYLQTSALLEARRHARELQSNRELADQAETSRFTELKRFLEVELKRQVGLNAELRDVVLARVDQIDRDLRAMIEQSSNTLSAYIGELEDRLEKGGQAPAPPQTT